MTRKEEQSPAQAQRHIAKAPLADPFAFLEDGLIDPAVLARARDMARQQGKPLVHILISQGILAPDMLIAEMARYHNLDSLTARSDLQGLVVDEVKSSNGQALQQENRHGGMINLVRDGQVYVALDVLHYDAETLAHLFATQRATPGRLLLITPELAQHLLRQHRRNKRLHQAIYGLGETHKGLSAREKTSYVQKLVLSFLFGLLLGGLALSPIWTLYVLGAVLNLLFLYTILLRLFAVITLGPRREKAESNAAEEGAGDLLLDDHLPLYTILVPLFREHRVVGSLIEHLLALDYPREKLEIKLIFEQGDEATLAAARACNPPSCFAFVIVPSAAPQTKPKALNYALAGSAGDYVVVFDAEDRPERDQLRKAVQAFRDGEPTLSCVQAGLNHYNINDNWLARQFTIEYTALFDGLLPALQRLGLPIPLGGTSNHFRTDVLREIGGWDAFNVTEDADLGIRLVRFGYRCEMLPSTTYEEACCRPRDWVCQRTRWLKGWLQTYLVHMRRPADLFHQLGARGFAGFQIILGAQVLSLIAHPLFIAFMVYEAWTGQLFERPTGWPGFIFWTLALCNFILGYAVAIWLGFATLRRRGYHHLIWQLPLMPLYWLLISFAAFRALIHYVIKPFHWEKTEHGLGKSAKKGT